MQFNNVVNHGDILFLSSFSLEVNLVLMLPLLLLLPLVLILNTDSTALYCSVHSKDPPQWSSL